MNRKFDLNDITLVPKALSSIKSRTEIEIKKYGILPIIVSPMDTVISEKNYSKFSDLDLKLCMPRGIHNTKGQSSFTAHPISYREQEIKLRHNLYRKDEENFISLSIDEFSHFYMNTDENVNDLWLGTYKNVLIDVANGHMEHLYEITKNAKAKYKERLILMVGNVANPETYDLYCEAGIDYVRISVGSGNACLTAANTGVYFPMGSLISECRAIANTYDNPAKIVADGGMRNYSDIIKSLALGADYVMVGSLLNKTIESSGQNYLFGFKISEKLAKRAFSKGFKIKKMYRGMSTKEVQKKWGKKELKTSEGITRYVKVEYTLEGWVDNFKSYLKSAMSYCGARNLDEFIGEANYTFITKEALSRFNK